MTQLHVYEGLGPCEKRIDICWDVEDMEEIMFSHEATIQAQRGW